MRVDKNDGSFNDLSLLENFDPFGKRDLEKLGLIPGDTYLHDGKVFMITCLLQHPQNGARIYLRSIGTDGETNGIYTVKFAECYTKIEIDGRDRSSRIKRLSKFGLHPGDIVLHEERVRSVIDADENGEISLVGLSFGTPDRYRTGREELINLSSILTMKSEYTNEKQGKQGKRARSGEGPVVSK